MSANQDLNNEAEKPGDDLTEELGKNVQNFLAELNKSKVVPEFNKPLIIRALIAGVLGNGLLAEKPVVPESYTKEGVLAVLKPEADKKAVVQEAVTALENVGHDEQDAIIEALSMNLRNNAGSGAHLIPEASNNPLADTIFGMRPAVFNMIDTLDKSGKASEAFSPGGAMNHWNWIAACWNERESVKYVVDHTRFLLVAFGRATNQEKAWRAIEPMDKAMGKLWRVVLKATEYPNGDVVIPEEPWGEVRVVVARALWAGLFQLLDWEPSTE